MTAGLKTSHQLHRISFTSLCPFGWNDVICWQPPRWAGINLALSVFQKRGASMAHTACMIHTSTSYKRSVIHRYHHRHLRYNGLQRWWFACMELDIGQWLAGHTDVGFSIRNEIYATRHLTVPALENFRHCSAVQLLFGSPPVRTHIGALPHRISPSNELLM